MADPERNRTIYVTSDSSEWAALDFKFGMISPPTIELHIPLQGTVTFYHADCYQLRIPKEAEEALYPMRYITVEEDGTTHAS